MEERAARARHTLRNVLLLAALTALAWGGYALFGRRLLHSMLADPRWIRHVADRWDVRAALVKLIDLTFIKFLVFVWCVFLAATLFPRLAPRTRWGRTAVDAGVGLAATVLAWFAVEAFLAPLLVRPLDLQRFYTVLDVDHRLPRGDPSLPTNADGIRSRRESGAYPAGDFNILFLGDSFTYGISGCDDAFPARAEGILRHQFPAARVNVANFGWVSSSPLLSLRLLREIGGKYHPRLVVLCFDMTDFFDDIHYRNMLERRGIYWYFDKVPVALRFVSHMDPRGYRGWEQRTNGVDPPRRYFMSDAPLERTRGFCGDTRRNLHAIDSCAKALGAGFMVVVLPRSYQYSARESPENWEKDQYTVLGSYSLEPFRYFDELRREVGYPVHSLLGDFQRTTVFPTCFTDDPHWNPAGNWIAARAIARLVAPEIEARAGLKAGTEPPGEPPREPMRRVRK